MTTERQLLLDQLPAKLFRSVVQDALLDNRPIPAVIIVGFHHNVIRYYRAVKTTSALPALSILTA
ncbi:hypothetical protein [Neolewinella persica]|uniref:hypothetical protein n=1 Tax=Neolewinella persica TaxID=70998 RepID=UPI00037C0D36|nr:hypothetical protein [Neolewinella persica]